METVPRSIYEQKFTSAVNQFQELMKSVDIDLLFDTVTEIRLAYKQYIIIHSDLSSRLTELEIFTLFRKWLKNNDPELESLISELLSLERNVCDYIWPTDNGDYTVNTTAKPLQIIREYAISKSLKYSGPIESNSENSSGLVRFWEDLNYWITQDITPKIKSIVNRSIDEPTLIKLSLLTDLAKLYFIQDKGNDINIEQAIHRTLAQGTETGHNSFGTTIHYPSKLNQWKMDLINLMCTELEIGLELTQQIQAEDFKLKSEYLNPTYERTIINWRQICTEFGINFETKMGKCPALPSLMLFLYRIEEYFLINQIIDAPVLTSHH